MAAPPAVYSLGQGFDLPAQQRGTLVLALRAQAAKRSFAMPDTLASLMLANMIAEGSAPGQTRGEFAGTNNLGSAQVPGGAYANNKWIQNRIAPPSLKADGTVGTGVPGWGAMAHKDDMDGSGNNPYCGWYFMAPSVSLSVGNWFDNYPGVHNALVSRPTSVDDYVACLVAGKYFGAPPASYIAAMNRAGGAGLPIASYVGAAGNPDDITVWTPDKFAPLDDPKARRITEAMYNKANTGGMGSAWKVAFGPYWPKDWATMKATNGIVFFGPPPGSGLGGALGGLGSLALWGLGLATAATIGAAVAHHAMGGK